MWFDGGLEKDIGRTQLDVEYGTSNAVVPGAALPSVRRHYAGFGLSYYL